MSMKFGIIGGSGFYKLTSDSTIKEVLTPFGRVSVQISEIAGKEVAFLPRHGPKHSIPPHLINYRANIYALFSLAVTRIISSNAVGSLEKQMKPGDFVIPDQLMDFTGNRPKTFFDGDFEVVLPSGEKRGGVVHADLTYPYCPDLRSKIISAGKTLHYHLHRKGIHVCTEGPRFETPAEINAFRILGGEIVGMTTIPECILARELGMCYATICIVTNYAAGMQEKITKEEVLRIFRERISDIEKLIEESLKNLESSQELCNCKRAIV